MSDWMKPSVIDLSRRLLHCVNVKVKHKKKQQQSAAAAAADIQQQQCDDGGGDATGGVINVAILFNHLLLPQLNPKQVIGPNMLNLTCRLLCNTNTHIEWRMNDQSKLSTGAAWTQQVDNGCCYCVVLFVVNVIIVL